MVEIKNAQEWLKEKYENKEEKVKAIVFKEIGTKGDGEELEGEMIIDGNDIVSLTDIEIIDLYEAKGITKLTIGNCRKVTEVSVSGNPALTEIVGLETLPDLIKLDCGDTKINKIDVRQNSKLREFYFVENTQTEIIGFETVVKNLHFWSSIDGIPFPWEQIPKKYLKETAKELGIGEEEIENKGIEELKDIVNKKAKQTQENEDKIKEGLPGLINKEGDEKGKINDDKLKELKNLDENKGNVEKETERLKLENEALKKEVRRTKGKEQLEKLLAQIEVPTNKS